MATRTSEWLTLNLSDNITHQISHNKLWGFPACNANRRIKLKVIEVFREITPETAEVRRGGEINGLGDCHKDHCQRRLIWGSRSVIKTQFKCKYCLSEKSLSGENQKHRFNVSSVYHKMGPFTQNAFVHSCLTFPLFFNGL